jgi:predicted ATPase
VVFVALAPLADPALVPAAVARALGLSGTAGDTVTAAIAAAVRSRQLLLVLDNCEHLLTAAADLVAGLLTACPALQVLATSRAPLRLRGERRLPLAPLPLPPIDARDPDVISQAAAAALFVQRAQEADPGFVLTPTTAPAVAEIVRRLDGLPLALELAAAWTRLLAPAELLTRLGSRLLELTGGPRDLPARQQTLRAVIAWSHDLLTLDQQRLFRRLAVFHGGWDVAAAEATAGVDDVLGGLGALADQGLLTRSVGPDGTTRFGMLEAVHAFALEQLAVSGEAATVRDRHAAYFAHLVAALDAAVVPFLPEGGPVLDRLEAEHPNLRAALGRLAETGQAEAFLRMAGALDYFWQVRGHVQEGQGWLERALALAAEASAGAQAAGRYGLAGMLRAQGAAGAALAECAAALTLAQAASEPRLAALAAQRGSLLARQLGRFADAAALETQSLQALDDLAGEAWAARAAATIGGHVPLGRGDLAEAERAFQEMIARQRLLGQEPGSTHPYACFALIGLGDVARGRGEAALALTRYQTGLRHAWRFGEMPPVVYALGGVAGALAALGRWSEAARLFGATEALCERTGLPFGPATMDRQRALGLPEPWLRAAEPVGLDEPLRTAVRDAEPRIRPSPIPTRRRASGRSAARCPRPTRWPPPSRSKPRPPLRCRRRPRTPEWERPRGSRRTSRP